MIVPLVFMFQMLLGGSLYATQVFVQLSKGNVQFKKYYQLLLHLISQVSLQKVVTTHNLTADYFDKFQLVQNIPGTNLKGNKSMKNYKFTLFATVFVHQEQVPFFPKALPAPTSKQELPVRPHRFDKYKNFAI